MAAAGFHSSDSSWLRVRAMINEIETSMSTLAFFAQDGWTKILTLVDESMLCCKSHR